MNVFLKGEFKSLLEIFGASLMEDNYHLLPVHAGGALSLAVV